MQEIMANGKSAKRWILGGAIMTLILLLWKGRAKAAPTPPTPPTPSEEIFPQDDWIVVTSLCQIFDPWELRPEWTGAGYAGGLCPSAETHLGHIKFTDLPTDLTQASFKLFPIVHYNLQGYAVNIVAGGEIIYTDNQANLEPIDIDVTELVRNSRGVLEFTLEPQAVDWTQIQYGKRYGGGRATNAVRPRIVLQ